jgi:hypothetical protein
MQKDLARGRFDQYVSGEFVKLTFIPRFAILVRNTSSPEEACTYILTIYRNLSRIMKQNPAKIFLQRNSSSQKSR